MFLVAVTRWGSDIGPQLPALAEQLGVFAYDLRMRLAGPLPVIVARFAEGPAASSLMATLRGWGHGAVGCDLDKVPSAASMHQPRRFEFTDDLLRTRDRAQVEAEVRAAEVYALIHALVLTDHQQTQERTTKKFSASRAVLTGGMAVTKKTSSTARMTESESEERIYVFRRDFTGPMIFCQRELDYAGLGDAKGHSSHESFAALTRRLREFCPAARYDDQLRSSRRKASFEGVSVSTGAKGKMTTATSSNASAVDLAAYLILVGLARGQL